MKDRLERRGGVYPIYSFHNKLMVDGVSGWMGVKEQNLLQLPAYCQGSDVIF